MDQNLPQIKVIVVGDSGVGKSSVLYRFVNDEFNEFSEPTLGAAFVSKVHQYGNNKVIRYQIWDTAGQQKYKSIAPIYYRGYQSIYLDSQIALCVYDITNRQSYGVLKNWVQQLKQKGPADLMLTVVGNKIDKAEEQTVSYIEAKEYANSIGALFKLTSAKQGKGINDLFTAVAQKLEEQKSMANGRGNSNGKVPLEKKGKKQKTSCCSGTKK